MQISGPFLKNLAYEMNILHTYADHEFLSFEISSTLRLVHVLIGRSFNQFNLVTDKN